MLKKSLIFLLVLNTVVLKAQVKLGDSLYASGNYAEAISVYKNLASDDAKLQAKIAGAYQAVGNHKLALKYYEKAVKGDSSLIITANSYAKLLRQTGKYEVADSVLTQLIRRFPENPEFHYQRGMVLDKLKDTLAISSYQQVVRLNPNHQNALYRSALYHYQYREADFVEALAKQAFETYPNNPKFLRLLALNSYSAGDHKLAAKRFENYKETNEISDSDLKKLAYAYYYIADFDKSIELFENLLEGDEYDIELLNNLGLLHNLKADFKEAERYLKKAIFLKRDGLGKQYLDLGLTYKGQEKYKQAMEYFRKALLEDSGLVRAQYELAICADNYYQDLQTRLNYYQKVIDKFENNLQANSYVESAEFRIKDLRKEIFLKEEQHTLLTE